MMKKVIERAPAKVNIYLKVISKRPDGYHNIETLFERIGIFDKIIVSGAKEGIKIKCRNPFVPLGKENLCYRAAHLVKKKLNLKNGVKIEIIKKIPVAGGLGGGSSDAASTLKALNKLWVLNLKNEDMMAFGSALGADVAFFLKDSSFAYGTGRGDDLESVKNDLEVWHLVITPDIRLLSGVIYTLYSQMHSLTLTKTETIGKMLSPILDNIDNMGRLEELLHNDLEDVVLAREPIIKKIKDTLIKNGARYALLSGSGPSVFGLYGTRKEALKARGSCLRHLKADRGWHAFVARTY